MVELLPGFKFTGKLVLKTEFSSKIDRASNSKRGKMLKFRFF